jgi:DNA-directed RNA polymerase subunit RPC12/RpoP
MGEYKDPKTGVSIAVTGEKFAFPTSGAKILLKSRPPIAREVETD